MNSKKFEFQDMTPELQEYLDLHFANVKSYNAALRDKIDNLKQNLSKDLLDSYWNAKVAWTCRDSTASHLRSYNSDSGQYTIHITSHDNSPYIDYSKGKVYRGSELIAEVCRNYSSFPFLFVEEHPKGDFLVCGEDYQPQTVINLITGEKRNTPVNENGFGFCWDEIEYIDDDKALLVEGCYWGAPFEFKMFDFSDPMSGWPETQLPIWLHGLRLDDREDAEDAEDDIET